MAAMLGRARSHIGRLSKINFLSVSLRKRDGLLGIYKPLILTASSSSVVERIEKKRQEALVGGGLKRIDRQHKRVSMEISVKGRLMSEYCNFAW